MAMAQTVTGSITGEVSDSTGAMIPGAHVVAHNLDTGVDTATIANALGVYHIEFLPIGHYQVNIQAPGFSTATLPPFALEVLQTATFNVKLAVGNSATTVNVSAATAPILDTNDATLGSTLTANEIQNFPLNGLDFSALTLYVPGSVNTNGTSGAQVIERDTTYNDASNINGNRAQANNYTLEGIDINETFNNDISYAPAPEALGEIKVITSNSPADYGNVNGGGVVTVLKSGTNKFHGSAYGYVQDYRLDANSWANNNRGVPINPFSQAQFGGTIGGPILHNKLFFFADYLGSRHHVGGTGTASVYTEAMRNGDFSALLGLAAPIQLYDPLNNFAPYNNNQGVPINNPVAKYLFAHPEFYPLPNATPTAGTVAGQNYHGPSRSFSANNQGDIKLEYDLSAKDKITGFYSMSTAYDGSTSVLPIAFPGNSIYPTKVMGSNWVHIFSPSLINSARVGFTRTVWNQSLSQDPTGAFGTHGDAVVGISFPDQRYNGFTSQGIQGGIVSNLGNEVQDGGIIDNTYSYIDNLNWQHGKHYLSIGAQALRYENNYPTNNNNGYLGQLNYTGAFTGNGNGLNGAGAADFVLDRVSSGSVTLSSINVGQRQWRAAGFAQDSYKLRPNLTLAIGLRYEFDQPWYEQNDKTGNIDYTTGQVLYAGHLPVAALPGAGICSNSACYGANYAQLMPHLGFAYQYNNRTVVRGGYGATSFFEGNSSNQRLTSIAPFLQTAGFTAGNPSITDQTQPTPNTAEQGFTNSTVTYTGNPNGFSAYPQSIQPAYVQNWNLTVEYALASKTSLQMGYVGEKGDHLEDYGNVNQLRNIADPTSAPFYNSPYIGINGVDTALGVGGTGSVLSTESRAISSYNALQTVLRQRLNHGLEFTLNYTWGKALTNSLGNYALNVSGYGGAGAFQNYYDSKADYGPAGSDVTHNVSGTGVYALPFGRGKEYFSGANRIVDEAIGGWKIAAAGVAYSGFPDTITGPNNSTTSFNGSQNPGGNYRANQYGKLKIVNRSINNWFGTDASATPSTIAGVPTNGSAFGPALPLTFGTSKNGVVRGPRFLNVDMSAFKDFHTYKEQVVGFRFDAFNAFNIVSYSDPDTNIQDSGFGQISSLGTPTRSQERRMQFSAHYNF